MGDVGALAVAVSETERGLSQIPKMGTPQK
jgi:hypothetical protein